MCSHRALRLRHRNHNNQAWYIFWMHSTLHIFFFLIVQWNTHFIIQVDNWLHEQVKGWRQTETTIFGSLLVHNFSVLFFVYLFFIITRRTQIYMEYLSWKLWPHIFFSKFSMFLLQAEILLFFFSCSHTAMSWMQHILVCLVANTSHKGKEKKQPCTVLFCFNCHKILRFMKEFADCFHLIIDELSFIAVIPVLAINHRDIFFSTLRKIHPMFYEIINFAHSCGRWRYFELT